MSNYRSDTIAPTESANQYQERIGGPRGHGNRSDARPVNRGDDGRWAKLQDAVLADEDDEVTE